MLQLSALTLLVATLTLATSVSSIEERQSQQRPIQYIFANECPEPVNLYISSQFDSVIPVHGNTTKFIAGTAGYFYTDANGGGADGARAAKAVFWVNQTMSDPNYYYMVRSPDGLGAGMGIVPVGVPPRNGFCTSPMCLHKDCETGYSQPPRRLPPLFDPLNAPLPPLYSCPIANVTYRITFCPSGQWPDPPTWRIRPYINPNKCLDVRGAIYANGSPVQIYDCNGTGAQNWVINRGSTKVKLAGTNFCLDAGSNPANGVKMKIWQCCDGLPAQQWHYTADNRIALENQGLCLDLPEGQDTNSNQVQTWQCSDNNINQAWTS